MKHYKVVAAVIEQDGELLCVKKGDHPLTYLRHKFEFPGGKIEEGEGEEEALLREIEEELQISIQVGHKIAVVNHQYPDFMITLTAFKCYADSRSLLLTEHTEAIWLPVAKLKTLDWAGADQPIVQCLMHHLV